MDEFLDVDGSRGVQKYPGVRLLFPNLQIRRLAEGSGTIAGVDGDAVDLFFEVIAVVGAAPSIEDLTALHAFKPARLDGPAGRRWGIPVGPERQLVMTINDGPPCTASLDDIQPRPHPRRKK